jgi:hypothetical protein
MLVPDPHADSVIRNFRITAADGKTYDTQHYSLAVIIAVVCKVSFPDEDPHACFNHAG